MQVSRTDIGVAPVCAFFIVCVMMMIVVEQQPCAEKVYRKTDHGHDGRLAELDRHGCEKSRHGLIADEQRNECKDDGTRKSGEFTELAGAEREARVVRVLAGETITQRGDG